MQVIEKDKFLSLAADLQSPREGEVVMPRKRVASIIYREICGDSFRNLLSNLSTDQPIDIVALELYAELRERIVPQAAGEHA